MENYFRTLPQGYREVKTVDAKEGKTAFVLTLISFVLTAIPFAVVFTFAGGLGYIRNTYERTDVMLAMAIFIVSIISYLILHELTHGAVYKALTHQKLTFGFTLTVAFCGVPDIYTSRRTALEATAAPFVVFSLIFIPLTILLYNVSRLYFLVSGALFSIHFGGCVGDLYMIILLLFRYRDPRTLMNDTGPKQTIYLPE